MGLGCFRWKYHATISVWGSLYKYVKGMPIDEQMNIHAGFTDYVNVYTVLGGVTVTMLCFLHGLVFLTLKTVGDLQERAAS